MVTFKEGFGSPEKTPDVLKRISDDELTSNQLLALGGLGDEEINTQIDAWRQLLRHSAIEPDTKDNVLRRDIVSKIKARLEKLGQG